MRRTTVVDDVLDLDDDFIMDADAIYTLMHQRMFEHIKKFNRYISMVEQEYGAHSFAHIVDYHQNQIDEHRAHILLLRASGQMKVKK